MKKGKKRAREKKTGTTGLSLKWLTKANYSGLKWLSSNFVFFYFGSTPNPVFGSGVTWLISLEKNFEMRIVKIPVTSKFLILSKIYIKGSNLERYKINLRIKFNNILKEIFFHWIRILFREWKFLSFSSLTIFIKYLITRIYLISYSKLTVLSYSNAFKYSKLYAFKFFFCPCFAKRWKI